MKMISMLILIIWIAVILSCSSEQELGYAPVLLAITLVIPFLYIAGT